MKTVLVILLLVFLAGCSALPSMQYCDDVTYTRKGSEIRVEAVCRAPVGGGISL